VQEIYRKVCSRRKLGAVSISELHNMCQLLEARGVVRVGSASETRAAVVTLQWDQDEVAAALGDKTLLADILNDKATACKWLRLYKLWFIWNVLRVTTVSIVELYLINLALYTKTRLCFRKKLLTGICI